ncbi:MAG: NUDIX hydrolase [Lachnospiraceae bacterium]|nr:NUDIX hydrolase [Lachnospiraceae bacterium]
MMGHLEKLGRRLVFKGEIVDLYKDLVELPDGARQEWDFVCHKNGGGAAIVPVLPDGRILLIRQYRPAVDKTLIELPAGGRDGKSEDTVVTARRELLEETGYTASQFIRIAHLLTAPAYCNEFTDVYLAENIEKVQGQHLDEAEEIRLFTLTPEEAAGKVFSGEITDAKTAAGITAYLAWKAQRREIGQQGRIQ